MNSELPPINVAPRDVGLTDEEAAALAAAEEAELLEIADGYYGLEIRTKTAVCQEDYYDYIDRFEGSLVQYDEFGENPVKAGEFTATRVRTVDATCAGFPADELWDTEDDICDYFAELFNPRTGELRHTFNPNFDVLGEEVLVLNEITVLPKHRGKNLGLGVASRLIDLFGPQWGLVVCTPFPLQFGGMPREEPEKAAELELSAFTGSPKVAMAKLRRYWRKMGFRPVSRKSSTFYLATHLVRPSISELCKELY